MKISALVLPAILGATLATVEGQDLPAPGFHHLHLNSTNPEAAIDYYTKQFPTTSKVMYWGEPALKAGNVYLLFTKVNQPPLLKPQTAIWHFGWNSVDERKSLEKFERNHVKMLPLYTGDGDAFVYINSDSWLGAGGTLGRTKAQIAEAKEQGIKPAGGAGFLYLAGPDGAMIEVAGNSPAERFNHVHMFEEDPFCAQIWYEKHLNAHSGGRGGQPQHTESNCKVARSERSWPALEKEGMIRIPSAGVRFDDVAMNWYANQGDTPLVSTRGHLADHVGLSVADLDAWHAKLKNEGVKFIKETYKIGDTRAFMIEGPSREALELIEIK